jgi:hypothetical protein
VAWIRIDGRLILPGWSVWSGKVLFSVGGGADDVAVVPRQIQSTSRFQHRFRCYRDTVVGAAL